MQHGYVNNKHRAFFMSFWMYKIFKYAVSIFEKPTHSRWLAKIEKLPARKIEEIIMLKTRN